jgi:hypothetical protein
MAEMQKCEPECHVEGITKFIGKPTFMRHTVNYYADFLAADFSLVPRGDNPLSSRFYQAIAAHSVPVVMADGAIFPFEPLVDYAAFVVAADETAAVVRPQCLIRELREMPVAEKKRLKSNVAKYSKALVYTNERGGAMDYLIRMLQAIWHQQAQRHTGH